MAAFEYSALTTTGKTKRGLLEADSAKHARRLLRDKELVPLNVEESSKKVRDKKSSFGVKAVRLSGDELCLITRLLGTLLKSGLPIDDALSALSRQADSRAIERVVLGMRSKVLEGHSLMESMAEFPSVFPEEYRATVGAGEQTQHLPLVLMRLAEHVEAREKISKTVRLAMVYPVVLTITALLVVSGLLIYVVPEVVQVFDSLDRALPTLTKSLIAVSDFMRAQAHIIFGLLLVIIVSARIMIKRPAIRYRWHSLLMGLPYVGRLLIESNVSRFSRMLAIMLSSSVDMLDALKIASKSVYLVPLQESINTALIAVREGSALHKALREAPEIPSIVPHLVASGESAGNLVEMLDTAAESLEYRVQNFLALALSLIEPLLIIVMGGIVLLIVIAILLPIFDMNQLI